MDRPLDALPRAIVLAASAGLLLHGPIEQLADYHAFADQRAWLGVARAADTLSNLPFLAVAIAAVAILWSRRRDAEGWPAFPGFVLFVAGLFLTTAGSTWYHLQPDDARLVWDRLPIALLCAGVLSAIHADVVGQSSPVRVALLGAIAAIASVTWWTMTGSDGHGDLRPYLLLTTLPLVLQPIWLRHAPRERQIRYAVAIALYVLAKVAELEDHTILAWTHVVSGHTLKHLLSAGAAAAIVLDIARSMPRVDALIAHTAKPESPATLRLPHIVRTAFHD